VFVRIIECLSSYCLLLIASLFSSLLRSSPLSCFFFYHKQSDNIFVKLNEQKEISELAIGDFDTAKKVSMKTHAKTLGNHPRMIA